MARAKTHKAHKPRWRPTRKQFGLLLAVALGVGAIGSATWHVTRPAPLYVCQPTPFGVVICAPVSASELQKAFQGGK